jgi:hypothetical protein
MPAFIEDSFVLFLGGETCGAWVTVIEYDNDGRHGSFHPARPAEQRNEDPPGVTTTHASLDEGFPHSRSEWADVRWVDMVCDGIGHRHQREYLRKGPLGKWADLAYDSMKARRHHVSSKAIVFDVPTEDAEVPAVTPQRPQASDVLVLLAAAAAAAAATAASAATGNAVDAAAQAANDITAAVKALGSFDSDQRTTPRGMRSREVL